MSFFTEIVKSAMDASTSTGQAETETKTQHLLNALLKILLAMGGVNGLVNKFQQAGLGDLASSWVGIGQNKSITPDQLTNVLGKVLLGAANTGVAASFFGNNEDKK